MFLATLVAFSTSGTCARHDLADKTPNVHRVLSHGASWRTVTFHGLAIRHWLVG
jgi:hypothetical protein